MPRRPFFNFETKPGRRDVFGAERTRYKNRFHEKLKGPKPPDDLLDKIVSLPEVTEAAYLSEEPWMADVTARLANSFEHSADMPGRATLGDIREERLAQALACGMRQTEAFKFAGYTCPMIEVLTERAVLHRIAYHRRVGVEACGVTSERIVAELAAIAFSQVGEAVEWSGNSVRLKDSTTLNPDTLRAIAEVKEGQWGVSLKFHSKLDGLRVLAQFKGLLKEKVELSGPDGKPIETISREMDPSKAAEAYAELIKQGVAA